MTQNVNRDSLALARKTWRTLEPYHGGVYFSPEAADEYAALGVDGRTGYFASRSAALGAAPADLVIATFYNFNPQLVRRAIPAAWEAATPQRFAAARLSGIDTTLRRILGADISSPALARAAELARSAAEASVCHPQGRPSSPRTRHCRGRAHPTSCSGTRRRCCGSSAATVMWRHCWLPD